MVFVILRKNEFKTITNLIFKTGFSFNRRFLFIYIVQTIGSIVSVILYHYFRTI